MEKCCKCIEDFKVSGILNEYTTLFAAYNGHLDCLKYAHENGCPWDQSTTAYAALSDHLNCLKYAHENGCSWDISTTSYAAFHGHLDCLKYALENGCPLNEQLTLSDLEKHSSKIDLDDKWWRSFLFEKDLTKHLILKNVIDTKKQEIKKLQEKSTLLISYISKDLTKYILWTYF